MLLTIHDANLKKVAFIDNDKQTTLNYYNDTWTRNLETGSSTFEFTVFKKAIKSDTASHSTYSYLNEKAFVSFRYKGKSYVFSVMTVEENEKTIKCYCENLNLELINEYSNPYKATKAMSFVEYCNAMGLLGVTKLSIGINEIADRKRQLEWEGQDTKLARLLSLANKFDAEIDFDTYLNADSSIKAFKLNVYHEYDENHQGVGRVRNDIQLTYGKNLKSITRKVDKTGIYTMVRPYGKKIEGDKEKIITIGNLGSWSENNADGVREFYQSGDALYAPLAAQMYPSTFTNETQSDQWIRKDLEVDSDNPSVIRAAGIRNLKKHAYPAVTYEVDGWLDADVGDTIRIYDDGFSPILLIKARVSDQKISFTNPHSNKTTLANFKALENNLSSGIQSAFERLFEASKPYLIKLSTDNGVIFKNQDGQTIVTPTLYKGGKVISNDVTWRWTLNGNSTTGMTYTVHGTSVVDTVTLTVAAYIGNAKVATDEISLVNVSDGQDGQPGPAGALNEEQIEEINQKIESKADNQLTQQQINHLIDNNSQLERQIQSALTMAALEKWAEAYNETVTAATKEAKKKAEEALLKSSERLIEITKLGEKAQRWETSIGYIQADGNTFTIAKDGSDTKFIVTNDVISFVSGGKAVMTLTNGELSVNNGVFALSVRVGRFVVAPLESNPDINVIRYVGEVS